MISDFSNPWVFLVWYAITAILLFASYKSKKAIICLIPVIYFLITLAISVSKWYLLEDVLIHRIFNFLGLAAAISFYIVIDEIETRRKVINQVFKSRYKKSKKKDGNIDESDNSES
jgi:zinc transporter ZupT